MFKKKSIANSNQKITTLIGEECIIEGSIKVKNFIKIDGQVTAGVISESGIILGEKGYIKGNAEASEMIVYGKIDGDIKSNSLILKTSSLVSGDISVTSLEVEPGASYKGTVNMNFDKNTSSSSKQKKEEKAL